LIRLGTDGSVDLEVPLGLGDRVRDRLARFAIRADVTIEVHAGAPNDPALRDERSRIDAGIPGASELESGLVAHGLDAALFAESVSFTKGCYPGQELVARMQARHAVPPYVLRRLTVEVEVEAGSPAGDASFDGRVTSIAAVPSGWHALAVVHRRDAALGELAVHTATGDVRARIT
jgi:folate-binding protein YgfZ